MLSAAAGLEVAAEQQPKGFCFSFTIDLMVNWFGELIQPKPCAIKFQVISFQLDELPELAQCVIE